MPRASKLCRPFEFPYQNYVRIFFIYRMFAVCLVLVILTDVIILAISCETTQL